MPKRKPKPDTRHAKAAKWCFDIPAEPDKAYRAVLERDDEAWLRHYFGTDSGCESPFTYEFTDQQREMIDAVGRAIREGGDQAIAASRGEGKTTVSERRLAEASAKGESPFSVLFAATGRAAENSLDEIKTAFEENDGLWYDYPELCEPVRALEGTSNRSHYQICSGWRHDTGAPFRLQSSKFRWCGSGVVLPNVPGAPGAGGIIETRGLDSAVRGLKKKGRRPSVVLIDDPDTEETARSDDQAAKLELRIDRAIAGLGTQTKPIARVLLCTVQTRRSIAYRYTDPTQKPSWNGKRFRFLVTPPDRSDLWDTYVQMRITDQQAGDPDGRNAHKFYQKNRKAMDAGAVVANPNRFDADKELSALQRYYNEVARIGQEAAETEYNNNPAEETGPVESGLSATRVQRQVSGYARNVIPPGCTLLAQGIDVRKSALHWVVRAWRKEPWAGYTVAYGVQDVLGTVAGSDEGVDVALRRAIHARWVEFQEQEWLDTEGNVIETPESLTLVDAGWKTDVIYKTCQELGAGIMPSMGFGRSAGCVAANFRAVQRPTKDKKPGDGWFLSRKGRLWLVCFDADRWKSYEHDRWMTSPAHPGALLMFGEASDTDRLSFDEKAHFAYSRHIVSESEQEDLIKGVLKRVWKVKSANNHWLDASVMANVAAAMKGYHWRATRKPPSKETPTPRTTTQPAENPAKGKLRRARRVPRQRVGHVKC
jgi:hypothetical protein